MPGHGGPAHNINTKLSPSPFCGQPQIKAFILFLPAPANQFHLCTMVSVHRCFDFEIFSPEFYVLPFERILTGVKLLPL